LDLAPELAVQAALVAKSPVRPKCGNPMILRIAQMGANAGN